MIWIVGLTNYTFVAMIDELTEAVDGVKSPQSFSTIVSLNCYEAKKAHFLRHSGITPYSYNVLLTLVNHWISSGKGMTAYSIIGTGDYSNYHVLYHKLTTLSNRGFVDCIKRSDGVNVFTPTLKAIEGINGLLVV